MTLKADLAAALARNDDLARRCYEQRRRIIDLRGTLQELRTRLHAAGRRPEECYEMGLIDQALVACEPELRDR